MHALTHYNVITFISSVNSLLCSMYTAAILTKAHACCNYKIGIDFQYKVHMYVCDFSSRIHPPARVFHITLKLKILIIIISYME